MKLNLTKEITDLDDRKIQLSEDEVLTVRKMVQMALRTGVNYQNPQAALSFDQSIDYAELIQATRGQDEIELTAAQVSIIKGTLNYVRHPFNDPYLTAQVGRLLK